MATSEAGTARRELRRTRYRKNIRFLTPRELNDLRKAYEGLFAISQTSDDQGNADPAGNAADERGYQWVAGLHGAPPPVYCQHGTLHFTTWHRAYIYWFEKLLQDQVPSAMLPWWDWTETESAVTGLPEAVTAATYEDPDTGETKPNPLAAAYGQVTQALTTRNPRPPELLSVHAGAVEFAMSQTEFPDFSSALENPHGGVHVWVGGDMGSVPTAAYDPVFWMHHANVDRLFFMWQQEHPNAAIPQEVLEFVCAPFNLTGADVMSAMSLGYSYAAAESLVSATDVEAAAEALAAAGAGATSGDASDPGGDGAVDQAEQAEPRTVTFELDPFPPTFRRATLELLQLNPTDDSYQAHIFFNNPTATLDTARTLQNGYAGMFVLFGHGECLGGPGHCDVPDRTGDPFDRRSVHHLSPFDTWIDVSFPLAEVVRGQAPQGQPITVTFVVEGADGEFVDASVLEFGAISVATRQ